MTSRECVRIPFPGTGRVPKRLMAPPSRGTYQLVAKEEVTTAKISMITAILMRVNRHPVLERTWP